MSSKFRCKTCRKFFYWEDAYRKAGMSSFCSSECFNGEARRRPEKKPDKRSMPKETRIRVLARDGYRCRSCGTMNDLCVHHIHYKSEIDNRPWMHETSNLITLCNTKCHLGKVHRNKKKYQPLCLQVVWLAELYGDTTTTIESLENEKQGH